MKQTAHQPLPPSQCTMTKTISSFLIGPPSLQPPQPSMPIIPPHQFWSILSRIGLVKICYVTNVRISSLWHTYLNHHKYGRLCGHKTCGRRPWYASFGRLCAFFKIIMFSSGCLHWFTGHTATFERKFKKLRIPISKS